MAGYIGGALPFGGSAANVLRSGNVAGNYASAYKDALNTNAANYGNILKGFQDTAAESRAAQQNVVQGYKDLGNTVDNLLVGTNQSNISDINNKYAKDWAGANQRLTTSGLGNTTVVPSIQRGFDRDRAAEVTRSRNQFANTRAGYMSNIGQANLGYQSQGAAANTNQANRQLDWMNSVNAPYPNASAYAALAQMQGSNRGGGGGMGVPPLPQGQGGYQSPMGMGGQQMGQQGGADGGQIGDAWNDFEQEPPFGINQQWDNPGDDLPAPNWGARNNANVLGGVGAFQGGFNGPFNQFLPQMGGAQPNQVQRAGAAPVWPPVQLPPGPNGWAWAPNGQ